MLASAVLAVSLLFAPSVDAFWKVACSGNALVKERADPIVSPGVKSNHVHVIHGGSGFSLNMTYQQARDSKCSSCEVLNDRSNYWTPNLWFQDPQTKQFEAVPNGGLLVYYLQRGNNITGLQTFPAGFRMLAGDMKSRSKKFQEGQGSQAELTERSIKSTCLRYSAGQPGYDLYGFPTTRCESGFQARIHMPNCWDGKNLDSVDHKSHVAFMSGLDNGICPSTHPVPFISMFYEQTWDVDVFDSRWDPARNKWPFVWAMGDPTGYGYHGDFVMGWDTGVLQNAIRNCDNQTPGTQGGNAKDCPYFQMQSTDAAKACTLTPQVNENLSGKMARLPGCNPVQAGPGDATIYSDTNCPL